MCIRDRQMAEAYHTHTVTLGTYPSKAAEYGADVRGRLEAAANVGILDYLDARAEAQRIRRRLEQVFELVDVILTPVSAGPPSTTAEPDQTMHFGRSIPFRELVMDYTVPQDITGVPVCAIPAGFDTQGLPIGVQVSAPWHKEDLALGVAGVLQELLRTHRLWP